MVRRFQYVVDPQKTPPYARVERIGGNLYVNWSEEEVSPSPGRALAQFAALAPLKEEEAAPSIVALTQRFGPLGLCSEHKASWWSLDHQDCTPLKPEPLSLWLDHARRIDQVLRVKEALDDGATPSVGVKDPNVLGEREVKARCNIDRLRLERFKRDGIASEEAVSEEFIRLDEWERQIVELAREREKKEREYLKALPTTVEEWWEWIADEVLFSLYQFPTMVGLERDPDGGGVRPLLFSFNSILARVYLELANAVSGVREAFLCSACGQPYAREGRRPKRGQRNYCPRCQATHVRKRIHDREAHKRR